MMTSLEGKVALITGAGREPARALALALARNGVALALTDLTPMAMEATAALALAAGVRVTCHVTDPSKGLAARMLIDEVLEAWESLDYLILHPRAEPRQTFLSLDEWNWQRTLETNLNGPFLLLQQVASLLQAEEKAGVFITLITSGSTPPTEDGSAAVYTSQAGLRALTQAAALELAPIGIRLYGIAVESESAKDLDRAARVCLGLCQNSTELPGAVFDVQSMEGDT